jgi:plastocyanin
VDTYHVSASRRIVTTGESRTPDTQIRPSTASGASDGGAREYDPRKDPKIIAIALIVFGTLAIALAGVGSTPVVGGDDGGSVFSLDDWRDDGPREVALSIEANRTSLRPGESVAFTVTYENGTPAEQASVRAGGTDHALDDDGRVVVTFGEGGDHTVTARQADTESVRYVADGEIISVERYEIPLELTANATDVTAGDDVRFRVRRGDAGDPVAASIRIGDETYSTDENGRAVVTFPRAGTFEAAVSKRQTETQRFLDHELDVRVDPRRVSLAIATNRSEIHPGESVRLKTFRTDTGEPIDTTISVANESLRTVDGEVTVEFDRADRYRMTASAPDTDAETYVTAQGSLQVDRFVAPIELSANRRRVEPGDRIRFTAIRTDTGKPTTGQLTVGDRELWLDRNGTATVTFEDRGVHGVTARRANTTTHRFPADSIGVRVQDTRYSVTEFEAPSSVARGESATASATIENVGSAAGNATVVYRFGNETIRTTARSLDPGERQTVRFDVPTDVAAGEYDHDIETRDDGLSASITVETSE